MGAETQSERFDEEVKKIRALTESLLYYTRRNKAWALEAAWILYDLGHDSLQGVSDETISEACQLARQGG